MPDLLAAWADVSLGTKTHFTLSVTDRADGSSIGLPVLVVKGASAGKTLLVIAGVHGDEFEGMRALHLLFKELDPQILQGTFIAVPLANPPAFEAGLRVNPDDRQDMARIFPGDAAGTVTEQLAYSLTNRFIRHADLFCDLHSAGQYYAMPPLCGYSLTPDPMFTVQRQAARAFGLPLVWGTPMMPGRSLSAAAQHRIPSIYVEITGQGRCQPKDVALYVRGLKGLLGLLEMTDSLPPAPGPLVVEDPSENAGFLQRQMRAPVGGLFEASVTPGERVTKGQEIGVVLDTFGQIRHRAEAPASGLVVFLRTFSRVLAGDPLACVLELRDSTPARNASEGDRR